MGIICALWLLVKENILYSSQVSEVSTDNDSNLRKDVTEILCMSTQNVDFSHQSPQMLEAFHIKVPDASENVIEDLSSSTQKVWINGLFKISMTYLRNKS